MVINPDIDLRRVFLTLGDEVPPELLFTPLRRRVLARLKKSRLPATPAAILNLDVKRFAKKTRLTRDVRESLESLRSELMARAAPTPPESGPAREFWVGEAPIPDPISGNAKYRRFIRMACREAFCPHTAAGLLNLDPSFLDASSMFGRERTPLLAEAQEELRAFIEGRPGRFADPPLEGEELETPLSALELCGPYRSILAWARRSGAHLERAVDVLDLDPESLIGAWRLGPQSVEVFAVLQKELPRLVREMQAREEETRRLLGRAGGLTLNRSYLDENERRSLRRYEGLAGKTATVNFLLSVDPMKTLEGQSGVGWAFLDRLEGIRSRVRAELREWSEPGPLERSFFVTKKPQLYPAAQLEAALREDFEILLGLVDETTRECVLDVWGYERPRRPLAGPAERLDLTREAVRLRVLEFSMILPHCLRLHPRTVWFNLGAVPDPERSFPRLTDAFAEAEDFRAFLDRCSGVRPRSVRRRARGKAGAVHAERRNPS